MNQVLSILKSIAEPLTKPETYQHFASKAIMVIVYLIVAWIVIRILNKIIQQFFKLQNRGNKGNKKRSKTLISLVQNIVSYVVWFIVITTILKKFGISVEGIIASAGVVGLAVGFGAQTIVKDLLTGFFIIFEGQFDVSDYVKINASGVTIAEGTVRAIGLRSTRIQSDTEEIYTVPNGAISEIVNYSATNVASLVCIPVAPNEDYDKIEEKLVKFLPTIADKHEEFVRAPELLGLDSVESNEMVIKLLAHVKPGMHFPGERQLRKEVKRFLDEEGIQTPLPTLVKFDPEEEE